MAGRTGPTEADWIISRGFPVYAVAHAEATVRGSSTVDADLTRLEERMDGSGRFTVTNVVLNPDAWEETDDGARAVVPLTGASESTVPLVYVFPECLAAARQCGLDSRCTAGSGTLTVYAPMMPKDTIRLAVIAMFAQSVEQNVDVSAPGNTVIAYRLPIASKDTLGAVKIGENISISEDGTISAKGGISGCTHVLSGGIADQHHKHNEECMQDLIATGDEVNNALDRALGINADSGDDESLDPHDTGQEA